ncbi:uncharacterized protein LOC134016719 [Osmerus eperlanus]|uniref:uncharacterized protein LOC134016719 n=1 Tax=Osmerus eperlanus TaxID=29151 RepID=UPI002E102A3B
MENVQPPWPPQEKRKRPSSGAGHQRHQEAYQPGPASKRRCREEWVSAGGGGTQGGTGGGDGGGGHLVGLENRGTSREPRISRRVRRRSAGRPAARAPEGVWGGTATGGVWGATAAGRAWGGPTTGGAWGATAAGGVWGGPTTGGVWGESLVRRSPGSQVRVALVKKTSGRNLADPVSRSRKPIVGDMTGDPPWGRLTPMENVPEGVPARGRISAENVFGDVLTRRKISLKNFSADVPQKRMISEENVYGDVPTRRKTFLENFSADVPTKRKTCLEKVSGDVPTRIKTSVESVAEQGPRKAKTLGGKMSGDVSNRRETCGGNSAGPPARSKTTSLGGMVDPEPRRGSWSVGEDGEAGSRKRRKIRPSGFRGKGQLRLSITPEDEKISIQVLEARGLLGTSSRSCDSYVKLAVIPDLDHSTRRKTTTVLDCKNPVFQETFLLAITAEDHQKRLLVTVWNRHPSSRRSEFLGCMSFGVRSLVTASKVIIGWYYLLGEELGRSKHLKVASRRIRQQQGGE